MTDIAREIVPVNLEDEMRQSYLDYAMSVIVGRALPDVRDGLKPVHRRVLHAMRELGNEYNRPYKKSARVVGDVIGKYHPHGDTAVYDTIVRMAQPFSMRYMLVDGQGNFGSVDGDMPAAMRYTEVRMSRIAHELLADIDTPEVDDQLRQAEADLGTAQANLTLSQSTNERWQGLLKTQSVSKQDADEKAGDAAAKKAAADSAAANVARLRDLESFKRVIAPFSGVITARNTDIGALINAGQSAGTELFRIADTHKLRIYVRVPEAYAAATNPGLDAELRFSEQPSKTFMAKTVRTSNALDPVLRTLQVELALDNAKGEIFPGAYAEVHFKLAANAESLRLPANTVLFRAAGLQVATVDTQHRVKLKSIVQGRDFGNSIEVLSGLSADDAVVLNPPDSIIDGVMVRVADKT